MFPRPIEKSGPAARVGYQAFLPVALFIWLLPLLAIFVTSIRPAEDINSGNIFGIPSRLALFDNYTAVFTQSEAAMYLLNSVRHPTGRPDRRKSDDPSRKPRGRQPHARTQSLGSVRRGPRE